MKLTFGLMAMCVGCLEGVRLKNRSRFEVGISMSVDMFVVNK